MAKFRKMAIIVMGLMLMFVGGYIFFLQTHGQPDKLDDKVMPMAACGRPQPSIEILLPEEKKETQNTDIAVNIEDPIYLGNDHQEVVVSTEEAIVVYNGDVRFGSNFHTVNDKYLYLYESPEYGEGGIYQMEIGSNDMERMDFIIPDHMEVSGLLCDINGRIHVVMKERLDLVADGADRVFMVYVLNRDGSIFKQIDITKHIENDEAPPFFWAIDQDGNYYVVVGGKTADLLVIDEHGDVVQQIVLKELGYEGIDSMGRGRDGRIYAILSTDKKSIIAAFDAKSGRLSEIYDNILPDGERWHRFLGAGTDTELFVYSRELGLFACDPQSGTWEYRAEPEPPEEDKRATRIRFFLPDGRFLRVEMLNDGNGNREESIFYYIAAGK